MRIDKIKSYLGFSIRSGKVIFGSDKLFEGKKTPKVVLICSLQNEKVTNKVLRFCEQNNIKSIKLDGMTLAELIGRDNCKVIGVLDKSLGDAIIKEFQMEN